MFSDGVKSVMDLWDENVLENLNPSSVSDEETDESRRLLGEIQSAARGSGLLALEARLDEKDPHFFS